jgi:hypothetical protein
MMPEAARGRLMVTKARYGPFTLKHGIPIATATPTPINMLMGTVIHTGHAKYWNNKAVP